MHAYQKLSGNSRGDALAPGPNGYGNSGRNAYAERDAQAMYPGQGKEVTSC